MGTGSLIAVGSRAMFASYASLQTTSNNIANANTAGYSRQQVALETAQSQLTGFGYFGQGVNVTTVTRSHDDFLTREVAATRSVAAGDKTRSEQLQQLEKVFATGEQGLGYAVGKLFNAFADVASKPQDSSSRQVVLARTSEVASRFRSASDQIDAIQSGITQDLKASVSQVNAMTKQIASLNQKIAGAQISGHTANDLLDQREEVISQLSDLIAVNTVEADDGTVSVSVGGGRPLVFGVHSAELTTVPDRYDPSRLQVGVLEGSIARELPAGLLGGGSVSALLTFQNVDMVDARNRIGQLAAAVTQQLNDQQALGLDLTNQAGGAMLSVGAPRTLAASSNTGTATVGVSIDDSSVVRASDYELAMDSASGWTLRRLSDNHEFQPPELPALTTATLAAGVQVDGLTIKLDTAGTPAVGDRFLLQPLTAAAGQMTSVLDDPRGIAAASPVAASVDLDNSGTLGVAALTVLQPLSSPVSDVLFRFDVDPTTQATTYTYSTDGGSTYSATPQALTANQPITWPIGSATPEWSLSLIGSPASGDLLHVEPTPIASSNNGNANALLALGNKGIVGGEVNNETGAIVFQPSSASDAYAGILSTFGVRVQSAKALATQSAAVAEDAKTLASSTSGVNLDEEAARLIQYQQSYQAAAKMLQVAQTVFDTLLQTAGR
jgi:flagellar hook-associated protein 1